MTHAHYIRRAIALAALAEGRTHPNPMVGAVVVRRGRVMGEGYHRQAGWPHAEVEALRSAGAHARGADLYVTLEPCCHVGRTPPCTAAILRAGVRRVIYGMSDPNPRVRGGGLRVLRRGGVRVVGPVLERACRALNPAFIHWATSGRPYVIVKVGISMDGKLADPAGRSQWITNAAARVFTHDLRARVDGICIGYRTLAADDPRLTVRLPRYNGPQPQPIVLLGNGPLPRRARVLDAGPTRPALWVASRPSRALARTLARRGHELFACPRRKGGYDLRALLRHLGKRGMSALLVEGGAATLAGFLRAGLVDYAVVAVAPIVLGGTAKGWTDGVRIPSLRQALRLDVAAIRRFGDNVIIEGPMRKGQ